MTLNEYQTLAARTRAAYDSDKLSMTIMALGLTGESGELADHIKKWVGHGHKLDRDLVVKELGDVLWYVANMADLIGVGLTTIGEVNIAKLTERYPDGFSTADSLARRDAHQSDR
jgi:NTP pyrophosphatase (non-canonical NTP hydrolase)